jgi:hypothetical protein
MAVVARGFVKAWVLRWLSQNSCDAFEGRVRCRECMQVSLGCLVLTALVRMTCLGWSMKMCACSFTGEECSTSKDDSSRSRAAGKSIECCVGSLDYPESRRSGVVGSKCMHATETGKQRPRLPSNHTPSTSPNFFSPPNTQI